MAGFGAVAALAEEVAGTGSRLKKRARIAGAIAAVHAESAEETALFCSYLAGLPFAEADPRKLNAGGALLTKAVLAVSGASQVELSVAYRRHGDLGSTTYDLLVEHEVSGPGLALNEVRDLFAEMAVARTTAARGATVETLLRKATALEAKYLLKLMLGDMRIGVKESLVEEAIASAASSFEISVDVAVVRHAVMLEADLGGAALRAFAGTLSEARMRLFHPLGFMLASPVETPEEAIARFTAKPPIESNSKAKAECKGRKGKTQRAHEEALEQEVRIADADAAMYSGELGDGSADNLLAADAGAQSQAPSVQAFLEDKFDGMRAQVHCGASSGNGAQPGRVAIYSRNREDITESFPELVEAFSAVTTEDGGGLIFDGEILGWDHGSAQALPFAMLGQRIGRKRVDNAMRQQVPVVFMAFDLMFADGELQLGRPLRERRNRLEAAVESLVERTVSPLVLTEKKTQQALFAEAFAHPDHSGINEAQTSGEALPRLMISPARLVESAGEIDRAYADARARANEGVMIKAANSVYQPGRRGLAWVKLKRVLDTLDVVVTGCEYGSGRKSQFLSDYTFAVRASNGSLQNVGKAYSGVTDAEIAELTDFFKAHTLEDFGHFRSVEPLVIFEVAFNNVMRSDRHASGFALRFPRILRIRTDKPLAEIDTVARVEEVYQSQVDKPVEEA